MVVRLRRVTNQDRIHLQRGEEEEEEEEEEEGEETLTGPRVFLSSVFTALHLSDDDS